MCLDKIINISLSCNGVVRYCVLQIFINIFPGYFVFVHSFWLTAHKALRKSVESGKGVSCYVNEVNFGPHLRIEASSMKNQQCG